MNIMKDDKGYLTPEEIEKLLKATKNIKERLTIQLLWRTGCRISELLQIRIENIDWKERTIVIPTLKRRKEGVFRRVFIDQNTLDLIKEFIKDKKQGLLLGEAYGWREGDKKDDAVHKSREIARVKAFQMFRKVGKRAGITRVGSKGLHPHQLRHSLAVHWVKKFKTPEDLKHLQKLLGHSSMATTTQYLSFGLDEEAHRKYDTLWEDKPESEDEKKKKKKNEETESCGVIDSSFKKEW